MLQSQDHGEGIRRHVDACFSRPNDFSESSKSLESRAEQCSAERRYTDGRTFISVNRVRSELKFEVLYAQSYTDYQVSNLRLVSGSGRRL